MNSGSLVSSEIDDLDTLLNVSLPSNRTYMLRGRSETRKIIVGCHFLDEKLTDGVNVLYIPSQEPLDNLCGVLTGTPAWEDKT